MEADRAIEVGSPTPSSYVPWIWDYDIDEESFCKMLAGDLRRGRLGSTWAAVRLLDYAPYSEIIRLLGFRALVDGWPEWRGRLRSKSRVRGFDFLVDWLPQHRPELLEPSADG